MNGFLWATGHLGWGIFAVAVFTALWLLFTDLLWRVKNTRAVRLLATVAAGWVVGVALIILIFFLSN